MRLFAAIFPSEDALAKVVAVQEELKNAMKCKASWTKPEKMHITLRFFGSDSDPAIAHSLIEKAASGKRRFDISLERVGGFPTPRRARVAFLDPVERIELAGMAAQLALEGDRRPHPHLTLARFATPQSLPKLAFEPIDFVAEKICLVRSVLGSSSQYEVLYEWELV